MLGGPGNCSGSSGRYIWGRDDPGFPTVSLPTKEQTVCRARGRILRPQSRYKEQGLVDKAVDKAREKGYVDESMVQKAREKGLIDKANEAVDRIKNKLMRR